MKEDWTALDLKNDVVKKLRGLAAMLRAGWPSQDDESTEGRMYYDALIVKKATKKSKDEGGEDEILFDCRVSAATEGNAYMRAICELIKSGKSPEPTWEIVLRPFRG